MKKKATGNDARPVVAESLDSSTWAKSCAKVTAPAVCEQVRPQQLAVGVSGGTQVMTWGWRLMLEMWEKEAREGGPPKGLASDDQVNAHNSFDRKEATDYIKDLSAVKPALRPLAKVGHVLLSVHKRTEPLNHQPLRVCRGCPQRRGGGPRQRTDESVLPHER